MSDRQDQETDPTDTPSTAEKAYGFTSYNNRTNQSATDFEYPLDEKNDTKGYLMD